MVGDYGGSTVGMAEKSMAALLPDFDETQVLKDFEDLPGSQRWKLGHVFTRPPFIDD